MEKEGKRIRRWRGGMDAVQTAQYLHDMAAEGWILDEVGYLTYIFREEAPQELTYRVVTLKEAATGEELAAYEAKGWKKAGNWEEQYIFVKERDLWNDDATERQMMVEEIDRRLEREKADRTAIGVLGLILFAFFGVTLFLQYGTDLFFEDMGIALVVQFGPNLVLLVAGGWLVSRRLRKKKERMLEGESVSARDTDWRGSRIRTAVAVAAGVLLIGWAIYIEAGWNEKVSDLPQEINYAEVPAVRLEKLEETELIRVGDDVETQKAGVKNIYGSAFLGWHSYDNAVRDHGFLLIVKETETKQRMCPVGSSEEVELSTDHYKFLLEVLAEKQYQDDLEWEREKPSAKYGLEEHHIITETAKGNFDALHICRTEFGDETELHILCREGTQVMEVNYDGQADADDVLVEIQKVFLAQK